MYGQDLRPCDGLLEQLRFLRYRMEVISAWQASEEKRSRLEAIQVQMNSLAALSTGKPRLTHGAGIDRR